MSVLVEIVKWLLYRLSAKPTLESRAESLFRDLRRTQWLVREFEAQVCEQGFTRDGTSLTITMVGPIPLQSERESKEIKRRKRELERLEWKLYRMHLILSWKIGKLTFHLERKGVDELVWRLPEAVSKFLRDNKYVADDALQFWSTSWGKLIRKESWSEERIDSFRRGQTERFVAIRENADLLTEELATAERELMDFVEKIEKENR